MGAYCGTARCDCQVSGNHRLRVWVPHFGRLLSTCAFSISASKRSLPSCSRRNSSLWARAIGVPTVMMRPQTSFPSVLWDERARPRLCTSPSLCRAEKARSPPFSQLSSAELSPPGQEAVPSSPLSLALRPHWGAWCRPVGIRANQPQGGLGVWSPGGRQRRGKGYVRP
jgi:hypothetical protein